MTNKNARCVSTFFKYLA